MSPELPADAALPAKPLLRAATLALCVFGAAFALLTVVYLALTASGPWLGGPSPRHWAASEFTAARGAVRATREGLIVLAPDSTGAAVISLNVALRSTDYPVIAWDAARVPEGAEVALLWRSDYRGARMFSRALAVEGGRLAAADLARDRDWIGTIDGLALALRGPFPHPILIRGVTAKSMTPGEIVADRIGEWLAFEPWNGASINSVTGGADAQDLPLPVFMAAVALCAALLYAALARLVPALVGTFRPIVVAAVVLMAWLVLDARWQWNLLRQAAASYEQYAGRSWRERHLAAEDGALFAFVEKARAALPPARDPAPRVFVATDAHYFRGRAAYHLYPYNVYFDPTADTLPPPSALRPGDYVLAYLRRGVQYDADAQRLRWDGEPPVAAELLVAEAGGALFRIR